MDVDVDEDKGDDEDGGGRRGDAHSTRSSHRRRRHLALLLRRPSFPPLRQIRSGREEHIPSPGAGPGGTRQRERGPYSGSGRGGSERDAGG